MNSWKVILAAVVIFGAGIVTGGLMVNHSSWFRSMQESAPVVQSNSRLPSGDHDHIQDFPKPHSPEMMNKQFLKQLDSTLKLTPEQRDTIQKILADGQEKNGRLWMKIAPDVRQVMQEVRQKIRAQLTHEQLKQFEEMMKRPPHKSLSTNAPPASATATNVPPGK